MNAPHHPVSTDARPLTFGIEGMTCASCVSKVEKAAKAVNGVETAAVNLATEKLTLEVGAGFDPQRLAEAVRASGYAVVPQHRAIGISGLSDASSIPRIEAALRAVPGVTEASVNLATERVTLTVLGGVDFAAVARAVAGAGYSAVDLGADAHAGHNHDHGEKNTRALLRDLVIAAVLTAVIVIIGMGSDLIPALQGPMMRLIGGMAAMNPVLFVLTTIVLFGPGLRFFQRGVPALWRLAPDMNSLVVLGTGAAWLYSTIVTFAPRWVPLEARFTYFESAAVIVTLILLGRFLEARAKSRTGAAVARLVALQAKTARIERNGAIVEIAIAEVVPGDRVIVRPGERIAVDGTVVEGTSYVDEAMISGEPMPVSKAVGATVIGGTVNKNGSLTLAATKVGADTMLASIIRMVEEAQGAKLPIQAVVDRVTAWFVPAVMAAAALTFVAWLVFGGESGLASALTNAVAVLIVACPCAMGLATPTSIVVGTGRAAELGVLFRKGEALQRLSQVKTVVFDKTGTLTVGRPEVTDVVTAPGIDEATVLPLIAAVESRSEHPLGEAVVRRATADGSKLPNAVGFMARPGQGVTARVNTRRVDVGSARFMAAAKIDLGSLAEAGARLAAEGKSPFFAAIDGRAVAVLAVADAPKPSAAATVAALRSEGLAVAMVTGDHAATAGRVARALGIDSAAVVAEVLPAGKVDAVKRFAASGPVAFVGDGINDAPALAAADVGIAVATGTDIAIESADVVLIGGDLAAVSRARAISAATMANIRQNLFWAFAYNVVLIPVAAGVLAVFGGPLLSPMIAGGAMGLSSVFVVGNALRLRGFAPRPPILNSANTQPVEVAPQ